MNEPTLRQLYEQHQGKVSDKWSIYLTEYDRLFAGLRTKPLRLLEIGVQNGGSLDIWARYFPNATAIVGCDINPDCGKLQYDDSRISLVVADVNTEVQLVAGGALFDLIIDDGSHTSSDIVRTFARYFAHLKEGGIFVVEDLHSTYWQAYGGGLFQPASAVAFFKRLVDVISHEHWGVPTRRKDILSSFERAYGFEIDEDDLLKIHSIEFVNSLCIVRKQPAEANVVGPRFVAGTQELVFEGILALNGSQHTPHEEGNPWSARPLPEDEVIATAAQLVEARSTQAAAEQEAGAFAADIAELHRRIEDEAQSARGAARERADSFAAALAGKETAHAQEIAAAQAVTQQHVDSIADLRRRAEIEAGRLSALQTGLLSSEAHSARLAKQLQRAQAQLDAVPYRIEAALAPERDLRQTAERNVALYQQQHEAILESTSWQLTAPVRWVGHKARLARRAFNLLPAAFEKGGGVASTSRRAVEILRESGLAGVRRSAGVLEQEQAAQRAALPVHLATETAGDPQPVEPAVAAPSEATDYTEWVRRYDTIDDALRRHLRARVEAMARRPVISIVMPTYNPRAEWLTAAVDSVFAQIYPNWELCIADDASTDPAARQLLQVQAARDPRIKIVFREKNGHISAASNSALSVATGEWIALMDHDDVLAEHALFWVVDAINSHADARLIYSDEDKVDESGKRFDPYFKSDWNIDLFYSQNLFSHLGVYHADLVRAVDGFRVGLEGSQDYDLVLRCIERIEAHQVHHVPRVLYHWRVHAESTASSVDAKPYAVQAGERALREHFQRTGIECRIESIGYGYRARYALPSEQPLVSLIIPTRNAVELVRQCINSILARTTYSNYEIIIVDNGSDDPDALQYFAALGALPRFKVIRDDREFNYSALNNLAVSQAAGEVIGLINNDIEVITPEWLSEMVSLVMQPGVGAVGARLWYPDDSLQHGGVLLGIGGVAAHAHKTLTKGHTGYFGRAALTQTLSAVTAACLLVTKAHYEAVGGLNEVDLKVAFNDVDFCLRLREIGLRNIWTPYADLYHHESATRGADTAPEKQERFAREVRYMMARWQKLLERDPAYNPNLTLVKEDYSLSWPPRHEREAVN